MNNKFAKQVEISEELQTDSLNLADMKLNVAKSKNSKNKSKAQRQSYNNAVKFKITDSKLINYLNYIHEIFLNEYELINQAGIQPNCFTKDELSHLFRGHFTSEAKTS